jgi:hypothetical protein
MTTQTARRISSVVRARIRGSSVLSSSGEISAEKRTRQGGDDARDSLPGHLEGPVARQRYLPAGELGGWQTGMLPGRDASRLTRAPGIAESTRVVHDFRAR